MSGCRRSLEAQSKVTICRAPWLLLDRERAYRQFKLRKKNFFRAQSLSLVLYVIVNFVNSTTETVRGVLKSFGRVVKDGAGFVQNVFIL